LNTIKEKDSSGEVNTILKPPKEILLGLKAGNGYIKDLAQVISSRESKRKRERREAVSDQPDEHDDAQDDVPLVKVPNQQTQRSAFFAKANADALEPRREADSESFVQPPNISVA